MASGHPLNDNDREPWLHSIRQTAERILLGSNGWNYVTQGGAQISGPKPQSNGTRDAPQVKVPQLAATKGQERRLAEVYETSGHDRLPEHERGDVAQAVKDAGNDSNGNSNGNTNTVSESPGREPIATIGTDKPYYDPLPAVGSTYDSSGPARVVRLPPAMLIACSALKRSYRALLRGERSSLTEADSPPVADSPLRTLHLYVDVSPEELLRRMRARKGHFMKEEMLKSQLATLEKPIEGSDELGIIVVSDGQKKQVERAAEDRVRNILKVPKQN